MLLCCPRSKTSVDAAASFSYLDSLHEIWPARFNQLRAGWHDTVLQDKRHALLKRQAELSQGLQPPFVTCPAD